MITFDPDGTAHILTAAERDQERASILKDAREGNGRFGKQVLTGAEPGVLAAFHTTDPASAENGLSVTILPLKDDIRGLIHKLDVDNDLDRDDVFERVEENGEWQDLHQPLSPEGRERLLSVVATVVAEARADQATSDEEMAFERQIRDEGR